MSVKIGVGSSYVFFFLLFFFTGDTGGDTVP